MRYLLLSVFVVSLVGILVIPHTFAETDNDIVSYVDSEGKFSIEFPDGWSIVETRDKSYTPEKVPEVGAIIKDVEGDTVIRINVWAWIKLDEPLEKAWAPNDLPYPEDYNDKDMLNVIGGRNAWYCSFEVYDDPVQPWAGCYKFDVVSRETIFTNEGRKLHMVEMEYILKDGKYYSIDAEVWDGENVYEFSARTTVKDSKQSYKFDAKNIQKIREVMKSLVILNPTWAIGSPTTQPESSVPGGESDFPKRYSIYSIPDWIKNNAGWWADGQIDDSSFLQGIQFLIKEGIMTIPSTETSESTGSQEVPAWIKNNAAWWADGQIDDSSFLQGIQYLVKVGIIKVS